MSRWFRFYDEAINEPKVLKLPEAMRWHWVALLCVASKNDGVLPSTADIALMLRLTPAKVGTIIAALVSAKLLDFEAGRYQPHNWKSRQYKSEDRGKDSYVYLIGASWDGVLKIGFSKNPWARLGDIQTSHHEKLSVLAVFRCKSHSEVELHDLLKAHRGNGEWFNLPEKICAVIRYASDTKETYENLVVKLRDLLRSATTETEQKQTTEQSRTDPRDDAQKRVGDFRQAIVRTYAEANSPSLPDTSRAQLWLSQGYDPEICLAVIASIVPKKPNVGLGYFENAIKEAHASKAPARKFVNGPPPMDWEQVVKSYKMFGKWARDAGNDPTSPACRAPPEILRKYGIEPISTQ